MKTVVKDRHKKNDLSKSSCETGTAPVELPTDLSFSGECFEKTATKRTQPREKKNKSKKGKYELCTSETETEFDSINCEEGSSSQLLPTTLLQQPSVTQNSSKISLCQETADLKSDGEQLTSDLISAGDEISAIMRDLSLGHINGMVSASNLAAGIDETKREYDDRMEQKRNLLKKIREENAQLAKETLALEKKAEMKKAEASDLKKKVKAEQEKLEKRKLKKSAMLDACNKAIAIGLTSRGISRQEVRASSERPAAENTASHSSQSDPKNDAPSG